MKRRSISHPRRPGRRLAAAFAAAGLTALALGCSAGARHNGDPVHATLVSYNVQNLFDDVDDGGEYAEFTVSGGWTRERYYDRLARIADVLRRVSPRRPDVVVLQEVEHAGVARDLTRDFLRSMRYVAAGTGPTTTRVVVLSRRRPERIRTHRVVAINLVPTRRGAYAIPGADATPRAHATPAPRIVWASRELVDVELLRPALIVLGAHWKSQSGGERETEWQRRLEAALTNRVAAERAAVSREAPLVLLGDLNQDLHEHRRRGGGEATALMPVVAGHPVDGPGGVDAPDAGRDTPGGSLVFLAGGSDNVARPARFGPGPGALASVRPEPDEARHDRSTESAVPVWRSLWPPRSALGTYRFRGEWERLDHAFRLADARYGGRLRVAAAGLLDADGGPARYDARTGRGVSDHLPIVVTVTRRRDP